MNPLTLFDDPRAIRQRLEAQAMQGPAAPGAPAFPGGGGDAGFDGLAALAAGLATASGGAGPAGRSSGRSALMSMLGLPPTRAGEASLRDLLVSGPEAVRRAGEQLIARQRAGGLFRGAQVQGPNEPGTQTFRFPPGRVGTSPPPSNDLLKEKAYEEQWDQIYRLEGGIRPNGRFRRSRMGAVGPGQVMPSTGPEAAGLAGLPWDVRRFNTDAAYNIALGRAYFREQLRVFGDPVMAAAAYNAGPGRLRRALGEAKARGGPWWHYLPPETREYVKNFRAKIGG